MAPWKLEHFKHFDKYAVSVVLVTIFRAVFCVVDWILDLTIGYTITKGTKAERKQAQEYDHSAQLVDILFKGTFSPIYDWTPKNFLYRHIKYTSPRFALENDNCQLMGVTATHAFFCVTIDPKKSVLDTSKDPFLWMVHIINSEQLLIMPLESFHRLAAELGDPDDRKVCMLDMTGRCGSTLLCQLTAKVPTIRSLSEPWAPILTHGLYTKGQYSLEQTRQVVRSSFRLICKPEHDTKIEFIFIKLTCLGMNLQPMVQELFPKFKFMFITRHYKPSLLSWLKFQDNLPQFFMNSPIWVKFYFNHLCYPYDEKEWCDRRLHYMATHPVNKFPQGFTLNYAANMHCFIKNKANYAQVILYEDFMKDALNQTKKFFEVLGVSQEFVPKAMEALKQDSQQGLFGGRGTEKWQISNTLNREVDDILRECKVPLSLNMSIEDLRKILF